MTDTTPPRDRIVDAAARLFAQRGFAATSIADVAGEAGLLKGNLAYYFKTKQELLAAVTERRQQALWQELAASLRPETDVRSAIQGLLAHVRATADELARFGCPIGSLSTELGKADAALQPGAAGLLTGLQDFLAGQFGRVMAAEPAGQCAEHLLAVLQGAAVLAHARHDAGVVRRQVDGALVWLDRVLA